MVNISNNPFLNGFKTFPGLDDHRQWVKTARLLKPMEPVNIVCGKKHGLPFEYLMTDIYSGCLPLAGICYGNCTAALFWVSKGYDFGKRSINAWDPEMFKESLDDLPPDQRWLRQGWMSDVSFSKEGWLILSQVSDILHDKKMHLMVLTKVHTVPDKDILQRLARNKVEIRVSVSALDTEAEIGRRLSFAMEYRNLGGISVPYVMSSKYIDPVLIRNQESIVDFVVNNDFLAGEHPLRIDKSNPLFGVLDHNGYSHPKFPAQYWFGRILTDSGNFFLPAPTHVDKDYRVENTCYSDYLSGNRVFGVTKNLPTYKELAENRFNDALFDHATYDTQKH